MITRPHVAEVLQGRRRYALELGFGEDLLDSLPPASIDLLITDPPYCSGGMVRGDRANGSSAVKKYAKVKPGEPEPEILGDTRDQRGYQVWVSGWLRSASRALRPGSIALVFTDWRQLPTTTDAMQAAGLVWRGIIPWRKGRGVRPQPGRPRAECEYIVWGTAGPRPLVGAPTAGSFFDLALPSTERFMVCSKPIALLAELAELAPPDGIVCDPFLGAGSTALGALRAGRRFIGGELSPENLEIAQQRLIGHLGTEAANDAGPREAAA